MYTFEPTYENSLVSEYRFLVLKKACLKITEKMHSYLQDVRSDYDENILLWLYQQNQRMY